MTAAAVWWSILPFMLLPLPSSFLPPPSPPSSPPLQRKIAPAFKARLVEWSQSIKMGDPLEEGCRLGPLVSKGQVRVGLGGIGGGGGEGGAGEEFEGRGKEGA